MDYSIHMTDENKNINIVEVARTIASNPAYDASGNIIVPPNTPDAVVALAKSEIEKNNLAKKLADAMASHAMQKAKADTYEDKLSKSLTPQMTSEQKAELEEIKLSDPDQYVAKITELRNQEQETMRKLIEEKSKHALSDIERMEKQNAFNAIAMTPGISTPASKIPDELPHGIVSKFLGGEIDATSFKEKAITYLTKPRVVGDGNVVEKQPSLNDVGSFNNDNGNQPTEYSNFDDFYKAAQI